MSEIDQTPAGLQMVIPGCERRTLPKSVMHADDRGQGLLQFYAPPTLREQLIKLASAPMRSRRGQKPASRNGLFSI
jgi:hypothetical protein